MADRDPTDWQAFFDRMVHDLREPLRSVHAFSEILKTLAPGNGDFEQPIEEITAAAGNMRILIDGVSRYGSTLSEVPPGSHASLQLAFDMASLKFDREIQATGGTLTGEGLPRLGVSLTWLSFVLENLIGNSLLFRGNAVPDIRVTAGREAGDNTDYWLIRVEDNGMGIETSELETAFRPFARLNGRKFPGAGLGLPACRNVVEKHGGRIWLESKPGAGCVCALTLPGYEA